MQRPVPPLPISPRLLKHFAAATAALTALIALFAGGEQSQVAQELAEREARNQLAQSEAEVIGPRELGQPDTGRTQGSWGSDGPASAGFSGGSTAPDPSPGLAWRSQLGAMRRQPRFVVPAPGATNRDLPHGEDAEAARDTPAEPTSPTAEQAAALLQSSQARSGSSGNGD